MASPTDAIPEDVASGSLQTSDATGGGSDSAPGEWVDFGTRDARRKENVVEPGPWKGEVLPQSAARGRTAPRTPKVEVFKDSVRVPINTGRFR